MLLCVLVCLFPFCWAFCPHECVCDDYSLEASCIKSNLEVMPMTLNPGLTKLILKYNNFHSVDASFNFYPELELVDLSSNSLVSIPDKSFSSQRRLRELRIEANKVSSLTPRTFSGLGRLEVLSLGHNLLDKLEARVFRPLRRLRELSLAQNRISEIEAEAFTGLEADLRLLDLSDNLLEAVPSLALARLTNLAELRLGQNNLRILPDGAFLGLAKLSTLDLGGNKLERVHEKAFTELRDLASLSLRDNELYTVPGHAFAPFTKLESLDLGQNLFPSLEAGALTGLARLTHLAVSGCPQLAEVEVGAFSDLRDLQSLSLASNRQLRLIQPGAFGDVTSLRALDLSNNGLTSVSSQLLDWTALASLDLSGNPWTCDCELGFLGEVIRAAVNRSEASVRLVRCWSPPSLRDQDVTKMELACDLHQSPKTDKSAVKMNNTELVAILCSSGVVLSVILVILILKSRKRLASCLSSLSSSSSSQVKGESKILQYSPYQQEPRYVSYQVVQTLHRPTNTIIVNPGAPEQSIVTQENYFMTLKPHEKLHYLSDLESEYAQTRAALIPDNRQVLTNQRAFLDTNNQSQARTLATNQRAFLDVCDQSEARPVYARTLHPRQYPDESIYQRVDTDDPVSDI